MTALTAPLTFRLADPRTTSEPLQVVSAPLTHHLSDGRRMVAIAGPHVVDVEALARWLDVGCPDPAPVRQGFAAALINPHNGEVTLAVGVRSEVALHWIRSRGTLVVGSHLPSLLQTLPTPPSLDIEKLARILRFTDDPPTTVYQGIHRVPAGHIATWSPGSDPWVRRWFDPYTVEPHDSRRDGDGATRLRDVITEAVELSLPLSGNVAAHLSGGLDSTTVVALASALLHPQGRTISTLSHVAAPGEWPSWQPAESDDEPPIRAMGTFIPGLDQHLFVHDGSDPIVDIEWFFDRMAYPFLNPSNLPWLRRMDQWAAAHDAGVMLTGAHGSIGYSSPRLGQYKRAVFAGDLTTVAHDLRQRRSRGDSLMYISHDVLNDFSPTMVRRWKTLRHGDPATPDRSHVPLASQYALTSAPGAVPTRRQAWQKAVLFDPSASTTSAPPGFSVWHSDPLGDSEVTRVLFSLGPDSWLGDGRDRALARRVTEGLLPDEVRLRTHRGVQGYDLPRAIAAHQREYANALERVEASATARELLNLPAIRQSMEQGVPTDGREAYYWQLFQGRALGMGLFIAWYEDRSARWNQTLA